MRAVFCGTPDFAVPALEAMFETGVDVPLVVSQPDRVRGRRAAPTPSPVRACALERGVPTAVLERGHRAELYARILDTAPDVVVVVAFGHIIREPLLNGPPLGCVNVHASLLPRWRGPAPIHTAIIAGDRETGVCTMRLAEGVDTGDVYDCDRLAIGEDETAGELHDRLAQLGAGTLVRTLDGLQDGSCSALPQAGEGITHAPLLDKAEGSVDFSAPARRVHDRIRGLYPWPGTTVQTDRGRLKLSSSTLGDAGGNARPGTVLAVDDALVVQCGDGAIRVGRVQAEGKRPMSAADYARGHGLAPGDLLRPVAGFVPREPRR